MGPTRRIGAREVAHCPALRHERCRGAVEGNGHDIRRTRACAATAAGAQDVRLQRAHANPGADDSGAACRARPDRLGADRHRQDRGLRAAGAASCRDEADRGASLAPWGGDAARSGAGADARTRAASRDAGRRVRPESARRKRYASTAARRIRCRTANSHAASTSSWQRRAGCIDHLDRGRIDLSQLEVLVLDEADRMLDMGFIDDVERICAPGAENAPDGAVLGDIRRRDRAALGAPSARSGTRRPQVQGGRAAR